MHRGFTAQFFHLATRLALLSLLPMTTAHAVTTDPPKQFVSGPEKVSLIELYTSEGCSSCPPADRWLSNLQDGKALWRRVVPVAFHVSYWDRLGWPDKFAQRTFDHRQRAVAARADSGVYTPGVFRDGAEFRSWRRTTAASIDRSLIAANRNTLPAGNLELRELSAGQWQLSYEPPTHSESTLAEQGFVAVLGNELTNKIARGENAGKLLEHDFVVLQLAEANLKPKQGSATNALVATFNLELSHVDPSPTDQSVIAKPALAAWVVDSQGTPIQALGGEL